jgi:hypothetical protein
MSVGYSARSKVCLSRIVAGVALSLLLLGSATAQSLGELARQEQAKKAAQSEPTAQHTYTNDNLGTGASPTPGISKPSSNTRKGDKRLFPWRDDVQAALKSVEEARRLDRTGLADAVLSLRDSKLAHKGFPDRDSWEEWLDRRKEWFIDAVGTYVKLWDSCKERATLEESARDSRMGDAISLQKCRADRDAAKGRATSEETEFDWLAGRGQEAAQSGIPWTPSTCGEQPSFFQHLISGHESPYQVLRDAQMKAWMDYGRRTGAFSCP